MSMHPLDARIPGGRWYTSKEPEVVAHCRRLFGIDVPRKRKVRPDGDRSRPSYGKRVPRKHVHRGIRTWMRKEAA